MNRPAGPDLRAGNAERVVGHDGHQRAALGLDVEGFAHLEHPARGILRRVAAAADQLDVGLRAAVADGRLVGVHFDQGVVDAHAHERAEDVLDGVDLHAAVAEGGGALDGLHVVDVGIDDRLVTSTTT